MREINNLNTPCFILNKTELIKSISGFQTAFSNCFSESLVGYSVKTNSLPYCMNIANEQVVMLKLCRQTNISWHCYAVILKTTLFIMAR